MPRAGWCWGVVRGRVGQEASPSAGSARAEPSPHRCREHWAGSSAGSRDLLACGGKHGWPGEACPQSPGPGEQCRLHRAGSRWAPPRSWLRVPLPRETVAQSRGLGSSSGSARLGLGAHSSPRQASASSRNSGGRGAGRTGQFPAMQLRPPASLSQSRHSASETSMPCTRRRVFVSLPAWLPPASQEQRMGALGPPHRSQLPSELLRLVPRTSLAQPAAAGLVGTPPRCHPGRTPSSAGTWA